MTRNIKHAFLIITALIFTAGVCVASPGDDAVKRFVKESGVPEGALAVKIWDLQGDSVIAGHNTDGSLIPASIMKSVTTAALFDKAGADWRYHTRVFVDGPNDFGMLRGNLIVVGACDPSIHSVNEPYGTDMVEEIVEAVKNYGLNRIEGDIIIDETEFAGESRPESWARGDFKKYYGTGSHAFNFSNNCIGDVAVENPSEDFIRLLKARLNEEHIGIDGKNLGEGRRIQILDHLSPPLDEIMRSCMMRSDNLFAECFLRTYGKLNGKDGSTSQAAAYEMEKWREKGLPLEGVEIVDGSGLSRKNRMTADFMTALLAEMSSDPTYASFFPLAGQEGTLKKFLAATDLDSYIAMKTGSMNGIQCYAGYKLDDDYVPTHVVVIMMNDLPKSREKAKKAAEKMLLEVFGNI